MKKIKILTTAQESYDYNTQYSHYNITDWEEVDDETYDILNKWANKHNNCMNNPYYVIIAEFEKDTKWCVENYLELIEEEKCAKEKKAETYKKAAKKRAANKAKKKREEELAQFEELKKKFEKKVQKATGILPEHTEDLIGNKK